MFGTTSMKNLEGKIRIDVQSCNAVSFYLIQQLLVFIISVLN